MPSSNEKFSVQKSFSLSRPSLPKNMYIRRGMIPEERQDTVKSIPFVLKKVCFIKAYF